MTSAHPALVPDTTLLGLRFQPGAAANWLGLPMSEIVGRQVDLGDLWGRRARDLAGRIGEARSAERRLWWWRIGIAETSARDRATRPGYPGRSSTIMDDDGNEGAKIGRVLDRLDISERTLRRRCHEHFGYGPKTLDRILRLQNFMRLVASGSRARAYRSRHRRQVIPIRRMLSREVRALCGMSAGALVRQIAS